MVLLKNMFEWHAGSKRSHKSEGFSLIVEYNLF